MDNIINELKELREIDLLDRDNQSKILSKLRETRNYITTSGFLDTEEDYIFNIKDNIKTLIWVKKDLPTRVVKTFNSVRASIVNKSTTEIIKTYKETGDVGNLNYFVANFVKHIPGRINDKNSEYIFRYFNDVNLEELTNVLIPGLTDLIEEKEFEVALISDSHKLLTAYLFINFNRYIEGDYHYSMLKIKSPGSVNLKKLSTMLSSHADFERTLLEHNIEFFILKIIELINSKSEKELKSLINNFGEPKLLDKIISVFMKEDFDRFLVNTYRYGYKLESVENYNQFKVKDSFEKLYKILRF